MNVPYWKISPEEVQIATPHAPMFHHFEGTSTTVCAVKMENGYVFIGESHCLDPDHFDKRQGEEVALQNALFKVRVYMASSKQEALAKGGAQ